MVYAEIQREQGISELEMKQAFTAGLEKLGERRSVLLIPPDITRMHGMAGALTCWAVEYYGSAVKAILPALGTHAAMEPEELNLMFPGVDHSLFVQHDWRNDIVRLGSVPSEFVSEVSGGVLNEAWDAQVNSLVTDPSFDLVLSLGQVVPHEVVGMANYSKNIFVGTGGSRGINMSHYLSALCGIEQILGQRDTPVRALLDYAQEHFTSGIPLVYALTVVADDGPRGLFMGEDRECFDRACELSQRVNITLLESAPKRVVVYLDPGEYHSTWLGNKAVYRTRMAIADEGELIVLAPGVSRFGEDREIDRLVRRYGYRGTEATLSQTKQHPELQENLSAAAHLIHGSSEGRFTVRYCPGHLSREEVESVGYAFGDLDEMTGRFNPGSLSEGLHTDTQGEQFYFIKNPAAGLWAYRERFENQGK